MPFRQIPRSVLGFQKAMDDGSNKSSTSPEEAITADTLAVLAIKQPEYNAKVLAMNIAKQAQMSATQEEEVAIGECRMFTSHYFQVFNLGVARGVYPATARTFYGIDANDDKVPNLSKENDVSHWAQAVVKGDTARVAAGGTAMVNPKTTEVDAKFLTYKTKHNTQSEKKDAYDTAQQEVAAMFEPVKALVVDMWDEVEFFYRHEPDEASKRRRCREWGVVYVSDKKGKVSGLVADIDTGALLPDVTVKIIETDESTFTDIAGKYELSTTLVGTGTLEFSLAGYITQQITLEFHEGGTLTQDVKMKKE
ncbi:MAG: carboxypeptidase-like regulatory domain-containing protein [Ignavibacteria bacterium]